MWNQWRIRCRQCRQNWIPWTAPLPLTHSAAGELSMVLAHVRTSCWRPQDQDHGELRGSQLRALLWRLLSFYCHVLWNNSRLWRTDRKMNKKSNVFIFVTRRNIHMWIYLCNTPEQLLEILVNCCKNQVWKQRPLNWMWKESFGRQHIWKCHLSPLLP